MGLSGLTSSGDDDPSTPQPPKPANSKVQETQKLVDQVVIKMKDNLDKLFERDAKLTELDDRAVLLEKEAAQFEKQGSKLKRKYWLEHKKMAMIIAGVVVAVLVIILGLVFGI